MGSPQTPHIRFEIGISLWMQAGVGTELEEGIYEIENESLSINLEYGKIDFKVPEKEWSRASSCVSLEGGKRRLFYQSPVCIDIGLCVWICGSLCTRSFSLYYIKSDGLIERYNTSESKWKYLFTLKTAGTCSNSEPIKKIDPKKMVAPLRKASDRKKNYTPKRTWVWRHNGIIGGSKHRPNGVSGEIRRDLWWTKWRRLWKSASNLRI